VTDALRRDRGLLLLHAEVRLIERVRVWVGGEEHAFWRRFVSWIGCGRSRVGHRHRDSIESKRIMTVTPSQQVFRVSVKRRLPRDYRRGRRLRRTFEGRSDGAR